MKTNNNWYKTTLLSLTFLISGAVYAQQPALQYFRPNNKVGLNVFESSKQDTSNFDGVKVRVGGDFAMQFQSINQTNSLNNLVDLGSNFNLPAANLNVDVQLYDGLRMHLRTYLSSKNHQETWVKGGYLQIDKLDFIKPGFLQNFMDVARVTIGLDEFNYGDAHFRRSDNARAIFNPFVGNYIMDSFSTEAFGEVTVMKNGFLGVIGITNGKLNQNVVINENTDNKPSFFGKIGYDNQLTEDFRLRLTSSWYINKGTTTGTWIYGGDRAGSRYYNVMQTLDGEGVNAFEGRFNPRFKKLTAIQVNPFINYKGLEFFGIYEVASNSDDQGGGVFTQLASELLYRFGSTKQFYLGGRYNTVSGEMVENALTQKINRLNIGGGWFITKNVMTKLEYVNQNYEGEGWTGTKYNGGEFDGINIEAVISF
ncbi:MULTISPECIES: hypothetical protein [Cyclobacterium]|jgi:hypothetical protein|uniref:Phosphate-selective porin O and P n=1 Tax=Cyclobacterium marinum (strain ATCC 25205 / DSM 745 / LMG 13164 / NCIMB 1802) TaxID=880070 RepID=G0J1T0_CYCMS|nr:hypothetical protein [Cyclobacterium marinum]AEL28289.1 hypothetical protein Cycma_4603 [Cyclobacterium marinum DSM 745]|tara:strand:+ start:5423 stop:6694 length:1272 start_codon:yes stop_codon:yes gene_type:complete